MKDVLSYAIDTTGDPGDTKYAYKYISELRFSNQKKVWNTG